MDDLLAMGPMLEIAPAVTVDGWADDTGHGWVGGSLAVGARMDVPSVDVVPGHDLFPYQGVWLRMVEVCGSRNNPTKSVFSLQESTESVFSPQTCTSSGVCSALGSRILNATHCQARGVLPAAACIAPRMWLLCCSVADAPGSRPDRGHGWALPQPSRELGNSTVRCACNVGVGGPWQCAACGVLQGSSSSGREQGAIPTRG